MADVTEARKASVAKKKDTGKQLTIEAALAGKEMIWCIQALNQVTMRLVFSLVIST